MTATDAVTVIGLGPMGQAMTRALLAAGHPVTVWNRTASKINSVAADGAWPAESVVEAIASSRLLILSLTDYQAMYDLLTPAASELSGRTIVNLSSDTAERTREAARWATEHGATFLGGGVMIPAPMVGTEEAYVYYSGSADALEQHRVALERIGEPRYLGTDPGVAQLMYQANLDVFLGTLSALMHATALVGSAGMPARDFIPEVMQTVSGIPGMLAAGEDLGEQLDAGEHPGHLSSARMMGATADHIVASSESAGIDLAFPRAVQHHYRRVVDDGRGDDNWTRIIDGIRTPAAQEAR